MTVKCYARSIRTHKLTLQALSPILLPRLNDHLDSVHEELRTELAPIGAPFDTDDIAQRIMSMQSMRRKMIMMMMTTHNEATTGQRTKRDRDRGRLVTSPKQQGVFHNKSQTPQNIMNKDVVIATIQESLLSAERLAGNSWVSLLRSACVSLRRVNTVLKPSFV